MEAARADEEAAARVSSAHNSPRYQAGDTPTILARLAQASALNGKVRLGTKIGFWYIGLPAHRSPNCMIRKTHLICSPWKSCCRAVSDAAALWLCRRWARACCRSTTCRRTTATWCSRLTATAGRPLVCSPVHCPHRECTVLGSGSLTAKTLTLVLVHCPWPAGTRYA